LIAKSRPRLQAGIYSLFHAIGALLMLLIVIYVWPIFMQNYSGGYYRGTTGLIEIPIWPFMAAVLVGGAATGIQFLILTARDVRRAMTRLPPP
jgi:TRAP-type C4-dicarboxylate transport system permease small subunit